MEVRAVEISLFHLLIGERILCVIAECKCLGYQLPPPFQLFSSSRFHYDPSSHFSHLPHIFPIYAVGSPLFSHF